jgi:hypothetical protein
MFKAFPKIPRLYNETCTITEKLDGTNACIAICPVKEQHPNPSAITTVTLHDGVYEMYAQSRTRIITPSNDNYGFANWVSDNAEILKELGPGHHYGEWWGHKIQRGYNLDRKVFSLFNVHTPIASLSTVPLLAQDVPVISLEKTINELVETMKEKGSFATTFDRPEGLMVEFNISKLRYKVILDK